MLPLIYYCTLLKYLQKSINIINIEIYKKLFVIMFQPYLIFITNMVETFAYSGYKHIKPLHDFIGSEAKGSIKQYRTCTSCRTRTSQKKNSKKRPYELEDEIVEEMDLYDLYDYVIQLLNTYTVQMENKENMLPFNFECQIDISTLNNSERR